MLYGLVSQHWSGSPSCYVCIASDSSRTGTTKRGGRTPATESSISVCQAPSRARCCTNRFLFRSVELCTSGLVSFSRAPQPLSKSSARAAWERRDWLYELLYSVTVIETEQITLNRRPSIAHTHTPQVYTQQTGKAQIIRRRFQLSERGTSDIVLASRLGDSRKGEFVLIRKRLNVREDLSCVARDKVNQRRWNCWSCD